MFSVFRYFVKRFRLSNGVQLVQGARRGAIYDLNSGKIYSIDSTATQILNFAAQGLVPLEVASKVPEVGFREIVEFLDSLFRKGLGEWYDCDREICPVRNEVCLEFSLPQLRGMVIEVTRRCNLKCIHCLVESGPNVNDEELKITDWKLVIDEASMLGCGGIGIGGGEPLLVKDLPELIQHAQSKGVPVVIFTNATVLQSDLIESLKNVQINVSIYGPHGNIHDQITCVPGSFQAMVGNVLRLKEYDISVRMTMPIMRENQNYIEETEEFAKGYLGIDEFNAGVILPVGRGCENQLTHLSFLRETTVEKIASPKLLRAVAAGRVRVGACLNNASFPLVNYKDFIRRQSGSCWSNFVYIGANGDVFPCGGARWMVLGNVRQLGLTAIVSSNLTQHLWSLTKDHVSICQDCEYRYAHTDCWVLVFKEVGSIYEKPPWCTYDPYTGEWCSTFHASA